MTQKSSPSGGMLTPVAPSLTKVKPVMTSVPQLIFNINGTPKSGPSIIDTLIEENRPAAFITEKLPAPISTEPAPDEVMEKLLQSGYVVEDRLYEGSVVTHLLAKSRAGDIVLLKVDLPQYKSSFPKLPTTGIKLERKSAVTLVPQETKMGILQCLNYDICGAAFICSTSMCLTERKGETKNTTFTEENFVFRASPTLSGGKIGRNVVPYPIVSLSKVLESPSQMEDQISNQAVTFSNLGFDRLKSHQDELKSALDLFQMRVQNIGNLHEEVKEKLEKEISQWTDVYNRYRGIPPDTLPEDYQTDYYLILRTLAEKKRLREKYLNGMANAYSVTGMVKQVSDELKNSVDPILNLYMESV